MRIPSFALLCLLAMLAWARPAHAETFSTCTGFITSIPAVISTQGTWCLKQDLATAITSGDAITINTNNVTIDCNDFKLGGQAAGLATGAYGINAQDRLNATVRHCNIRGFYVGLALQGSSSGGHLVEDNRFDGITATGLYVEGDGSTVQRNRMFDTGGRTATNNTAVGIYVYGSVDVLNNAVSNVFARVGSNAGAIGILSQVNLGGSILGNRVRGVLKDGSGQAFGIYDQSSGRVVFRNNDLIGPGITGLQCGSGNESARDNVFSGFTTGMSGCSDAGENFTKP